MVESTQSNILNEAKGQESTSILKPTCTYSQTALRHVQQNKKIDAKGKIAHINNSLSAIRIPMSMEKL